MLLVVRVMIFFLEESRRGGEARGLSNPLGLPFPQLSHHLHADKSDTGTSKRGHRGMHTRDGCMHVRASSSTRKVRGRGSFFRRAGILSSRKAKSMASRTQSKHSWSAVVTCSGEWGRTMRVLEYNKHARRIRPAAREKRKSTEQCRASGQIEPRDTHF